MCLAGAISAAGSDPKGVERALNSLVYGPREPRRVWTSDRVALGFVNQGRLFEAGESAVLWEGRLDNRADLVASLNVQEAALSDSELLWLAWRRWGDDFLVHVYGEFACAIWDAEAGKLVLGRDVMGTRPLFYWRAGGELLFASEPRGLWADDRVEKGVNPVRVAEWLCLMPQGATSTLYENIERVRPGHVMIWDGAEAKSHPYWRPESLPELKLASDEAYVEALREAFEAAVARRIPASGEVGCHLSAGLDSSSVAAIAALQLARQGRRLTAFTAAPRDSMDESLRPLKVSDEFPLAASVARLYPNIDHVRIHNDALPLMQVLHRHSAAVEAPVLNMSNMVWIDAIDSEARRRGIRVMLTGQMGNMTISYDGWRLLPSLFRRGRWLRLLREWRYLRTGPDRKKLINLISLTISPLLPPDLKRAIRRLFGKTDRPLEGFSIIDPAFAEESGLGAAARRMAGDLSNVAGGDGRRIRVGVMHRNDNRGVYYASVRRLNGIQVEDPTADRALIELCLSIPEDQFLHKGEARSMVRRMMAGLLPPELLAERRKGQQAADYHLGLTEAREELAEEVRRLENSPLASRCLDIPRMKRLVDNWPEGGWHKEEVMYDYLIALSRGLATGHFIRRIEGSNY